MSNATLAVPPAPPQAPAKKWGDQAFKLITLLASLSIIVLIVALGYILYDSSKLSINKFGFGFITGTNWDSVAGIFGALPYIYGTLSSSLIGLLIAVPLSVATAAYLTDLAPVWLRQPVVSIIEMLAAVPSVIWGLWAILVMVPFLRDYIYPTMQKVLEPIPLIGQLFSGPIYGVGILSSGIILAVMIIPIITSVSREILRSVPNIQREAAYALGATRWEVTRIAVLSYAKRGLLGASVLGLGRALGETMAVTMVIGNKSDISASLFAPGYSLASVIANEFGDATTPMHQSALAELALVLLGVTLTVNIAAMLLVKTFTTKETRRVA
ncbi:MAG: phosphate ABC transporter permease subunit PstC [Verrucomicrobiales bacterium]|jgi:phosphate transport system permease protein|nr:phosphate ABC transporter permease subunit PstC [Verrucomicrobiales bacterium]